MIITTKIADNASALTCDIGRYVSKSGTVEIQMSSMKLRNSWGNCVVLLEDMPDLEEVVLHLPFGKHNINIYPNNCHNQMYLTELIVSMIKYSHDTSLKMWLLFHVEEGYGSDHSSEFLVYLLRLVEGTHVGILLENSIPDMGCAKPWKIPAIEMIQSYSHPNLCACLDLCHLQATEHLLKQPVELTKEYRERIHEVHFSATLGRDGYLDKAQTHARRHRTVTALRKDYEFIQSLNLCDSTLLTTEICENDYANRPDMLWELGHLYKLQEDKENGSI